MVVHACHSDTAAVKLPVFFRFFVLLAGRHDRVETAAILPVICLADRAPPCQPHVVAAESGATEEDRFTPRLPEPLASGLERRHSAGTLIQSRWQPA
jgi:hypothetical protein